MIKTIVLSSAALICATAWSAVGRSEFDKPAPSAAQAAIVKGMMQRVWPKGREVAVCFGLAPMFVPHRYIETLVPGPDDVTEPPEEVIRILRLEERALYPVSACSVAEGVLPARMTVRASGEPALVIWLRDVKMYGDSMSTGRAGFGGYGMAEYLCESRLRSEHWERAYCIRDWGS